jgi:hypothetical protein
MMISKTLMATTDSGNNKLHKEDAEKDELALKTK